MARLLAAAFVWGIVFWSVPAPADDPDVPEKYMKVDEVRMLLDKKTPVVFLDVRPKDQFDELHIKGARNIPLHELSRRLDEVSKRPLTVLY